MLVPQSVRFVPRFARIVRRWGVICGIALIVVVGIVRIDEGAWPSGPALAFTIGGLALLYLAVLAALWHRRSEVIDVSPAGVRVVDRRGTHVVRWGEITRYRHHRTKTERWWLYRRAEDRLSISPEGLATDENTRLRKLLHAGLEAHGLAEALPNGRYRPLR